MKCDESTKLQCSEKTDKRPITPHLWGEGGLIMTHIIIFQGPWNSNSIPANSHALCVSLTPVD